MIFAESKLYCGSDTVHSAHGWGASSGNAAWEYACTGLIGYDGLIHLYLDSDTNGWSGKHSYSNWRKEVAHTRKWHS